MKNQRGMTLFYWNGKFLFHQIKKKIISSLRRACSYSVATFGVNNKTTSTNTQCYRSKQPRSASKRSIEGKDRYLTKLLTWKVSAGYEHFSLFQRWGNKQAASLFEAWQTHSNNNNNNPLTLILPYKKILEIFLPV